MSGAPLTASGLEGEQASSGIEVAGVAFVGDPLGALYWPEQGLLAVADLHLEKGSSYATRGVLLPPYDTAATLARLARLIARYAPRLVVALGDSFHDRDGPARVAAGDLATLRSMQRGRDWIWIAGNHDPQPGPGSGGGFAASLATRRAWWSRSATAFMIAKGRRVLLRATSRPCGPCSAHATGSGSPVITIRSRARASAAALRRRSPATRLSFATSRRLVHVPEKWIPVFR